MWKDASHRVIRETCKFKQWASTPPPHLFSSVQFSGSVVSNPMNPRMPGHPVHHQHLLDLPKPGMLTPQWAMGLCLLPAGDAKWSSHFGRRFGSFLQNSYYLIQQIHTMVFTQKNWKLMSIQTAQGCLKTGRRNWSRRPNLPLFQWINGTLFLGGKKSVLETALFIITQIWKQPGYSSGSEHVCVIFIKIVWNKTVKTLVSERSCGDGRINRWSPKEL